MRALTEELFSSKKRKKKCLELEFQLLEALRTLNDQERSAIYLRYWVPYSIDEVSKHMHISWTQADQLIESSLQKLRDDFKKAGLLS